MSTTRAREPCRREGGRKEGREEGRGGGGEGAYWLDFVGCMESRCISKLYPTGIQCTDVRSFTGMSELETMPRLSSCPLTNLGCFLDDVARPMLLMLLMRSQDKLDLEEACKASSGNAIEEGISAHGTREQPI